MLMRSRLLSRLRLSARYSSKPLIFNLGTSCKPKDSDLQLIPPPITTRSSFGVGQDALFSRLDAFGVADGVGGWTNVAGIYILITGLSLLITGT